MIELSVSLNLPLRAVVLGDPNAGPPEWLAAEYTRMPEIIAAWHSRITQAASAARQQLELDQLRQQREAWRRGLAELQRTATQVDAQCAAVVSELREAAVELAHAIASKLVFQQLAAGTFPVERLVTEVLSRLNTRESTTVSLHPDDLAVLQRDDLAQTLPSEGNVRLIGDPKLARGDCKAVAGEITVVYELHRQIEEIRRELLSTVNGHAEPGP